jgi:hypothetical protein
MLRILACGGRDYENRAVVFSMLDHMVFGGSDPESLKKKVEAVICHGGARGADWLAGEWARARGVPCTVYYAQWDKYGKRAGILRNQQMLDEFKPTMTIAFPGGRGTADMMARSRAQDVPVLEVTNELIH